MRECNTCHTLQPLDNFAKDCKNKSGRRNKCKQCYRLYQAERMYGANVGHVSQSNCDVCGIKLTDGGTGANRRNIDHCHITGEIRGVLCHRCNTGLGLLGDSLSIVEALATYLRKTQTN